MPILAAARRASSTAPREQQPPYFPWSECSCHIWSVMAMTSYPSRWSRAAVTALSTPPLIAATTVPLFMVDPRNIQTLQAPVQLPIHYATRPHPQPPLPVFPRFARRERGLLLRSHAG